MVKWFLLFLIFIFQFNVWGQCPSGASVTLGPDQFYCSNSSVTLTPSFTNTPTGSPTYTWTGPSGTLSGQTGNTLSITTNLSGFYSVSVDFGNNCILSDNVDLTFLPIPTINANQCVSSGGIANLAVNFNTPLPSTITPTYSWIGPNGFTSSVANPSLTSFNSSNVGTYNVTVSFNPSTGPSCVYPLSTILNLTPVTPTFSIPANGCLGTNYSPTGFTTQPNTTYSWTVTPASSSTGLNGPTPVFNFTNPGLNSITVTATQNGCSTTSSTQGVSILNLGINPPDIAPSNSPSAFLNPPTLFGGAQTYAICGSNNVSAVLISNFPPSTNNSSTQYSLAWGTSSGVNFAANSTTTQSILIGNNPFTLTASYGGCTTSVNYNLYVGSNPYVSVGVGNSTGLCPGQNVVANITPVDQQGQQNSPGTTYNLYFSNNPTTIVQSFLDITTTTAATPVVFNQSTCGTTPTNNCYPSQSNVYYAYVVATNACANSCASSPAITINDKPDADFTISSNTVCPNTSVTLTNTGSFGNTVTGNATSGYTCSTTTKIKYVITPSTGFTVTSGSLGGTSGNFNSWNGTNTVVLTFNTPGTYSIKQYAQSNNCGADSIVKTICVINPPTSAITANVGTSGVCSPATLALSSNSILPTCGTTPVPVSYTWSVTNPSNCSGCSNTVASPNAANSSFTFTNNSSSTQTFAVNLTVAPLNPATNQPLSSPSCANTSSVNIQVYPGVQITPLTTCNGNLNWNLNNQVNVPSTFTWQANSNNEVNGETTSSQSSSTINDNLVNTSNTSQTVTYTVNATSNVGSCTATATFTVNLVTPLVVQPLSNQTICVGGGLGSPLTLVYTGGTGNPTFNWVLNSSTTSVSSSNPYNPPSFANPGTFVYTGTVSRGTTGCVQTASQQATITVIADPTITSQPTAASYCLNASPVTPLSVVAAGGSGSFSYQWYSNNTNSTAGGQAIANATAASFVPPNSSTGSIYYYCIITQTGLNCSVTSAIAQITVTAGPIFTSQPQSQTICVGGTLNALNVAYSGGSGTASYQWYSNNSNANTGGTLLSGETNATLTLPSTLNGTAANSYYYCVISFGTGSGCSVITSNVATISVIADPTFSVQPNPTQTICVNGALASPLSVTVSGGSGTPTYQWYTVNSSTYTPISNSNNASYNPPAFANAGTFSYAVSVTQSVSGCASANSSIAEVVVVADPTVSTPTGANYCQNASPVTPLSVTATGGASTNYSYQWFNGTTLINGATSNTYTPSVATTGTANYTCQVTISPAVIGCAVTSNAATITVTAGPIFTSQPQSQTICVGGTLNALNVAYSGGSGTASYQWYSNNSNANTGGTLLSGETNATLTLPSTLNGTAANSYYYCVISFGTGSGCSVITSNVATISVIADPTFSVQPNPTQTICVNGALASPLSVTVSGGSGTPTYQWYTVNSSTYTPISNSNNASYNPPAFANAGTFSYAVSVTQSVSGCASANSSIAEVVVVADPTVSTPTGANYCQNASPVTPLSVTATGGASTNYSYQWFNGTTLINGATSNTYTPSVATTGTANYTCQVTISPAVIGCSTTSNQVTITVNSAPTFSTQPLATQTICLDGTFNALTVATQNGTGTPTFQWYSNTSNSTSNGSLLSGETNNNYTPPSNVVGTNYYYCIASFASGGCSSITSTVATAIVVADPVISAQPIASQSICVGGTISTALTASATGGTGTTTYQWSNAAGPITGGTNQTYLPPNFATVGQYSYTVTITLSGSGCNALTTQNALIEVVADPIVSTQPVSASYCQNGSPVAPLTLVATGGVNSNYIYQWYNGALLISGATSNTYTPSVATTGTANYSCQVTISPAVIGCSATSNQATITVNSAPTFSTQPLATQTICLDGTFNALTVATQNGTGTPTFQWFSNTTNSTSNGTLIAGATNSSYTPPSNVIGANYYYCIASFASGGCSSITSTVATAIVVADPVISAQPIASQSICVGGTISTALTASATGGTGTTSYQWSNASGPITGATNQTYLPPSFATVGQYSYSVTITLSGSGCNALTTQNALIEVVADPIVSTQPVSASYCQNGSPITALSVVASGGIGTFSYQWYSNTSNTNSGGTLIPGATSSSYTPSVAAIGTTYYYCSITQTGLHCNVTSNTASIVVNQAPAFVNQPISQTICIGGTFSPLSVTYQYGTGVPSYQWYSNSVNSYTGAVAITGATNPSYQPDASTISNTFYFCEISFSFGGCTSISSLISNQIVVNDPIITSQPLNSQTICVGGTIPSALLVNIIGGTGTTTYQWFAGSNAVSGATQNSFVPSIYNNPGIYNYTVNISSSGLGCAALTSQVATVEVLADPLISAPLAATYCQNASPVTALQVTVTGGAGTNAYQWYASPTNTTTAGATISNATTSSYTPPVSTVGTVYYYCIVTQSTPNCATTSLNAPIQVNLPPTISVQPLATQTLCEGGSPTPLQIAYINGTNSATYQWYTNNVNSNTGGTPLVGETNSSYNPPSTLTGTIYYYCVITFQQGGCSLLTSISSQVTVVNDPAISLQPVAAQEICQGSTINNPLTFNYTGGTGNSTIAWYLDANPPILINGITTSNYLPIPFNIADTFNYYATISFDGVGCNIATTQLASIIVHPTPYVTNLNDTLVLCNNGVLNIPLTATVTSTFQWDTPLTNSVNGESFLTQTSYSIDDSLSNTTTVPQFLTYSVTPTSVPYGCIGPDSTVVVQLQPDVILSMNQAIEICSGSPVNAILSSNVPSTYNWFVSIDNPNITGESILPNTNWFINDALTNTSSINQVVVYSVFPVSIDGSCPGIAQPLVVTVKPPIELLNPDTLTICSGSNVGINLVANTNVQFNWYAAPSLNVLNETTSVVSSAFINDILVNPTNAVEIVTYNVIGTSTANGCSSPVLPLYVVVNPIPSLINLSPLTICNGSYQFPYSLQTSVNGGTTNWSVLGNPIGIPSSFGSNTLPGFMATNNSIITQTGQIEITPIFTNNNVSCIGTDSTLFISVLPTPIVNNIADIEVCNLEQVPLTPVSGPVPNTYFEWINSNIGTGLNATGIGDIPIFVGLNPGVTPISGTVAITPYYTQNNLTCSGIPLDFDIIVNPSPVLVNSDIEICDQEFVNLLLNANISSSFIWNAQIQPNVYNETAAPIQTTSLINDQLVLATTTQQTVTYNVTPISTPYGCYGNDTTIEVIVHPLPVVDFTVISPILCNQAQINFQNNSVGSLDYTWTFGDGDSSFLINPVHAYANYGAFLIELIAIDQITGCSNTDSQVLTINQTPNAGFIISDSVACGSLDVVFNALDLNPNWSYLWAFGDGTISNQYGLAGHQYVTNGCFDVSLQISTPEGCIADTTQLNAICIYPEPIAAFSMDNPVISSLTPEVQFFNSSLYADTYFWDFGDGTSSITENPNHLFPTDPATYVIVLTASNQIGCQDTAAMTVTIWQDLAIYVPNTFTPDGNEYNQTFKPILTEGFKKDSYHLIIFNRWGEVVFESFDVEYGWDGYYGTKSKISQDGTYTWKIEIIELQSGETRRFLGHVNLIR